MARHRVTVAGLGPAGVDLLPSVTLERAAQCLTWLRTTRHPAAASLGEVRSFDEVYDSAEVIDDVYDTIVERLLEAAETEPVLYLVPGSPLVAERTVELLRAQDDLDLEIIPAVSFLDLAWARLGIDPVTAGVALIDGHRFEHEIVGRRGPLLIGQCDHPFVLSDIKLAMDDSVGGGAGPLPTVTVLQRLGLGDEAIFDVAWDELDRGWTPDHLTTLFLPDLPPRPADALSALHAVVAQLRAECPWDRDQSHVSLAPYAIEEANEVAEAIAALDPADPTEGQMDDLVSELGDLLFQVMLHSAIAEEAGDFSFIDVAEAIRTKMIRRHPHVFDRGPDDAPLTMSELAGRWEAIKQAERNQRAN